TLVGTRAGADDLYGKAKAPKSEVALPPPTAVKTLAAEPTAVALTGDETRQLIITGNLAAGRAQDLTGDVQYEVANPKVVRVTSSGRVVPVGNGETTVTA